MINGARRHVAKYMKQEAELTYWRSFVERFFSPIGVLRQQAYVTDDASTKQYEISYAVLARFFYAHFEGGVTNMQMLVEKATEKTLPNNCHYIESPKASFIYWFDGNSHVGETHPALSRRC
jgi:hypothetical protein